MGRPGRSGIYKDQGVHVTGNGDHSPPLRPVYISSETHRLLKDLCRTRRCSMKSFVEQVMKELMAILEKNKDGGK